MTSPSRTADSLWRSVSFANGRRPSRRKNKITSGGWARWRGSRSRCTTRDVAVPAWSLRATRLFGCWDRNRKPKLALAILLASPMLNRHLCVRPIRSIARTRTTDTKSTGAEVRTTSHWAWGESISVRDTGVLHIWDTSAFVKYVTGVSFHGPKTFLYSLHTMEQICRRAQLSKRKQKMKWFLPTISLLRMTSFNLM